MAGPKVHSCKLKPEADCQDMRNEYLAAEG